MRRVSSIRRPSNWTARYAHRLLVSDSLVVATVTSICFVMLTVLDHIPTTSISTFAVLSLLIGLIWVALLTIVRSRDSRVLGAGLDEYRRVVVATCVVYGATAITALASQTVVPRSYFVVGLPLGIVFLSLERALNRQWLARRRAQGAYLTKVIVVGELNDTRYVIDQIGRKARRVEYDVIGAVLPEGSIATSVVGRTSTVPVVGFTDNVPEITARLGAQAVIVAGQLNGGSDFVRNLGWALEETSTELVLAPGLTNIAGPRIHWRPVDGLPLMHVELPQYYGTKHVIKRIMDIVLSAAALLVLAPALAIIAILVKRDSEGPVIFRQRRMGHEGTTFTMLKFRTMSTDAEARRAELLAQNEGAGVMFKMANDPRVTRVGRVLRKYSLDELPQFWNVLIGEMSLVGPRPWLENDIPNDGSSVSRRLYSKPGITGLWQTEGRSDLDWEESVRLDLYYVENWSVTGDVALLFRTTRQLLVPSGAY
ncbi:polyprenyl glycosylphosphotransferase [Subtercola sp. Z020]|nr:polyprenyl glycosylphosphotransferase [Subtercola sp. Z020]